MTRSRRPAHERGQLLVLTALMLPVLIGFVGLALDGGLYLSDRTKAQRAADAAALAGVAGLPDVNAAVTLAQQWSSENNYTDGQGDVSVSVTTPYKGDPDKVEVVIHDERATTFLRVLGINTAHVTARAVAERTTGAGNYVIFANNPACPGDSTLEASGSTKDHEGQRLGAVVVSCRRRHVSPFSDTYTRLPRA